MTVKVLHVCLNLALVALFSLFLEAVCHRDPWAGLPNGYSIGATNNHEPCSLTYMAQFDPRPRSDWVANSNASTKPESFWLENRVTHEMLSFNSEPEWKAAIRKRNARPYLSKGLAQEVTQFGRHGAFVFGNCSQGYFLLDTDNDECQVLSSKDEWEQLVAKKTGRALGTMRSPKSFWVQTRPPLEYEIIGGFILLSIPWILVPVWNPWDSCRSGLAAVVAAPIKSMIFAVNALFLTILAFFILAIIVRCCQKGLG